MGFCLAWYVDLEQEEGVLWRKSKGGRGRIMSKETQVIGIEAR